MLRDYFVHFHFQSPLRFAEEYYHHYPKVAFGHWPPFFYMLQAVWMAVFSAARTSVRLQIACTTALLDLESSGKDANSSVCLWPWVQPC